MNLAMGVLLLISLLSCSNLPEANQNWVIITRKQPERILIDSRLKESDGFWTPSANDIYKLEEGIAEYLNQNSRNFTSQPPAWERLDEYQRQYIGLERGGKQIIYGNYFCEEDDNWRKEFVLKSWKAILKWWESLHAVLAFPNCCLKILTKPFVNALITHFMNPNAMVETG